jgi:hypothetical protein
MLAAAGDLLAGPGWAFEFKYDGPQSGHRRAVRHHLDDGRGAAESVHHDPERPSAIIVPVRR